VKRISSAFATSFRTRLLSFYDTQHRKLPWRESADPYRVMVSEFMLQQTRVETVIPYYQRWLHRFPDVHALAQADPDDVLKAWEGLGYYSRARNLQRAAQMVREQYNGDIPAGYAELQVLPGVGTYTAAAIASISFAQPHAAVDGNVRRVLSRVLDEPNPTASELQRYADQLLDANRPGDFNQAMMELGATVCTLRNPTCSSCPVQQLCRAHAAGTVLLRPAPKPKAALPHLHVNTLVAVHRGEVLLTKRPEQGLLAGLWEFPEVTTVQNYRHIGEITHTFTHKRITYRIYVTPSRARVRARARARPSWMPIEDLTKLTLPTAQRRIAKLALPHLAQTS
jgi:A/G-specific adenine glycosylase